MKVLRKYFVLLLILTGSCGLYCREEVDLSNLICDVPACNKIAQQMAFNGKKLEKSFLLKIGLFSVYIPDEPIAKIAVSEQDFIVYYENGKQLLVGENQGPNVGELKEIKVNQYPHIVF
jgi:hypothetical protein